LKEDFFIRRAIKYIAYYLFFTILVAASFFIFLFMNKTNEMFINKNSTYAYESSSFDNSNIKNKLTAHKQVHFIDDEARLHFIKTIVKYAVVFCLVFYLLSMLFFSHMFGILYEPMKEVLDAIDSMSKGETVKKVTLTGRKSSRELAAKINRLSSNLSFIRRIRQEFLIKKSYEFNNIVYSIVSLTEDLSKHKRLQNLDENRIELIKENSKQLLNVVKGLNDYYLLENDDSVIKESVDIKKLIEEVFLMTSEAINKHNVKLINNIRWEDSCVEGDNIKLYILLSHLIENAIRYSIRGEVTVEAKKKKDILYITIKDSGVGIKKDELKMIKEFFKSRQENIENGIGLTLSKKIIDMHQGFIDINSKANIGTEVTIGLKSVEKEIEHSIKEIKKQFKEDEIGETHHKHKVLFYCNNLLNVKLITSYLSKNKYRIEIVDNKDSLIELISFNSYDILIVDYFGIWFQDYQLIRDIRKVKHKDELHILLINNKNRVEDIQDIFKAGVNDIINKPLYRDEFLVKVENQLKIRKTLSFMEKVNESYIKEKRERILAENLRDFHTELTSTLNVKKIFLILFRKIKYLFDYDSALVLLKQDDKYQIIFQEGTSEKFSKNDKLVKSNYIDPVVKSGKIVVINEYRCREYFSDRIKSAIAIPLRYKKDENCLIIIKSTRPKFFKNLSKGIIDSLFYQSSIAINNANLYGELEKRNVKLNMLIEKVKTIDKLISVIYNESNKNSAIYYLLLVLVGNKMNLSYNEAYYFEYEPETTSLLCKNYQFNISKYSDSKEKKMKEKELWAKNLRIPLDSGSIISEAYKKNTPLYNKEIKENDRDLLEKMEKITILPIKFENSKFGLIVMESDLKRQKSDKYEKESLSIFAANLGIYLQTKKLEEESIKYHQSRVLNTFAKSIVHELRTPLVGIKGFATMTKEKYKDDLKLSYYMNNIISDAERVIDLSSQIVDFAEEENARYYFKNESFTQGIIEVIKEFEEEIQLNEVEFKYFTDDFFIPYDKVKMKKVFRHIIKNSLENIDDSKERNIIHVTKKITNDRIVISFIDNGVGIDENILKEIFNPLVSTKIQGTGLGLTLSKSIVEKNAFELTVESKRGHFTKVNIIIS
jgi:signal transduction histidine kinase/DNA-binding response OmpR family regulator